ncbi:putative receptor-like protein kinase [Zea mays]|uniref:non-specific serine/threonine protein kinase n=1 Tax=Zea mays TaxID=4577 RepID=A0A3L6FJD2_MAIZE|nr:putative receptor-like protein kinase [Zea mays]
MKAENTLSWEKLFDVATGTARGLEYLHRGCNTPIVHFDIKPHNILLDQDFCPKISDFGLAKLCPNKASSAVSIVGARGTVGYIAPEVYSKQFGVVSSKSDVYSYGMMVLEMVGARDKSTSADSERSSQYFPQWIYEHLDDYCVSASEVDGGTTELVRKMIVVGQMSMRNFLSGMEMNISLSSSGMSKSSKTLDFRANFPIDNLLKLLIFTKLFHAFFWNFRYLLIAHNMINS